MIQREHYPVPMRDKSWKKFMMGFLLDYGLNLLAIRATVV